jgi:hypothetical protein
MRRAFVAFLVVGGAAGAQAPPSTDIFLAPLSVERGRPVIGSPVNVTHRPGYDNQPSFTPNSRSVLFTSVRDDGQSDIYRYDLTTKATTRVTSTPESEYSATVMPGGKRFSVIRVEKDSAQRLWSFALDGSNPRIVIKALKPVGYHAWIGPNDLALFVLGRPNALVHTNVRSGKSDTLARDIGRSLQPLPRGGGFSFTQRVDSGSLMLKVMRWPSRVVQDVIRLPGGTEDVVWLSNDLVLAGSGNRLILWRVGSGTGPTDWQTAADLTASGITKITRLAVSPDRKWIAIVGVPAP